MTGNDWLALGAIGALILLSGGVAVVSVMGKLNPSQILTFAANAGFSGNDLITAVAVALAESAGDPNAHGDTTIGSGLGSFGLWQIYADAHPEYGPGFSQLYDPQTNANAAFAIYQQAGNQFTPWSAFKNGHYQSFMSQAQAAEMSA
jgi:hypothetical protein